MKKIVIVANIDPLKNFWGVEFVCKSIAYKLSTKYEVFIISRWSEDIEYRQDNITVIQWGVFSFPVFWDFAYARFVDKITKKINPDLLIDNGSLSFLTRNNVFKLISIVHGTNFFNLKSRNIEFSSIDKYVYRFFWSLIQRNHLKNIDYCIAVSFNVWSELQSHFYKIDPKKIKVIDNWTYIFQWTPRTHFSHSAIFISNNHQWKWVKIIEKVATNFPFINFKIIWEKYTSSIPNIVYLWKKNHSEILEELLKSDFFIFPSIYEWQSLAVLDALASWLPVILSEASDPGIIENWKNGYIVPTHDVPAYERAIKDLYENIEKFKNMSKNNVELMKNYTWEKQSEKYLDFINTII